MKFLAIIMMAFSLSGCFYQTVNNYDLQEAAQICGSVDKVAKISSYFTGEETVTCNNNVQKRLHRS